MKMRSWCRKALALTASFLFAALLSMVPVDAASFYISNVLYIPITIHDYAADGMLFEWNNLTGTGIADVDGKTVCQGNNDGFGLLTTSEESHRNLLGPDTIEGSCIQSWGDANASQKPAPRDITLENNIKETIYGGTFRTGLVEPVLGPDRKPVYRKETVDFLAEYLSETLPESLVNEDGSENLWYVMGTELEELGSMDLASVLRRQIMDDGLPETKMGSYSDAKTKAEAGGLQTVFDVTTYYDAAYFLLADLFRDSTGYGKDVDAYQQIMLLKDGDDKPYTFYSGYTDTNYDSYGKLISNYQVDEIDSQGWEYGFEIPKDVFDPLNGVGYGNQNHPYQIYMGSEAEDDVNHNLTLESHGKFIYREAENQYFYFFGDDDAYLYLNGILAVDMGGSHPIAKAGIQLNTVAERLGLVDGQMYDFDFFYMDRQGKRADLGIETNIKLMNPAIVTDLKAFQDQKCIGYGGSIDPDLPVTYQFSMENISDRPVFNIEFMDFEIGTMLKPEQSFLNGDTLPEDILVERRNADGSDDLKLVLSDIEELDAILREGLNPGQKLILYGFKYQIDEEEWTEEDQHKEVFRTNLITMASVEDSHYPLIGYAEAFVTKTAYTYARKHYYDWGKLASVLTEEEKDPDILVGNDGKYPLEDQSEGFTISKEALLKTAVDAGAITSDTNSDEYLSAEIELCSYSGSGETSVALNSHAERMKDGSVHYQTDCTGVDTFYYQIMTGTKVLGPIAVDVYTYGVSNNTYILDYGLPVELYDDEEAGLGNNDLLSLASVNPAETVSSLAGIRSSQTSYGTFSQGEGSLIYRPESFMNGSDEALVEIQIIEKGAQSLTPETGVMMSQTVTIVPASVVYYEDDFEGLTYISEDGNVWMMYEGFDENGNSTAGQFQSADQEGLYGSDSNYELDHEGRLTLVEDLDGDGVCDFSEEELGRYEETLCGDASNDKIHMLNVQKTADILSFDFSGTGFDIISRTTAETYCVLSVSVINKETEEVARQFPVISECRNGELDQVPLISVKDLPYGTYQVVLRGARSKTSADNDRERILYLDGVRIYEPLEHADAELYYKPDEQNVNYYEIRDLIGQGKALLISRDSDKAIITGSTYIEDADEYGFLLRDTSSLEEYLSVGPNNEIYLNSAAQNNAVLLWLEALPGQTGSIQIGAHRKCDQTTGSFGAVNLVYGGSFDELEEKEHVQVIESGTENYYNLDISILQECEEGYLIMIGTTESENDDEILALTNLKLSGFEPLVIDSSFLQDVNSKGRRFLKGGYSDQQSSQEPEPTMVLDSLKFKNEKVTAGKSATLLVVTDLEADSVVVLDENGAEVAFTKSVIKQKDQKNTHTLTWKAEGRPGERVTYTVFGKNDCGQFTQKETVTLKIQ